MEQSTVGSEVLLTHGYAGSKFLLRRLVVECRRAGFSAQAWGYASVWFDVVRHARKLRARLERLEAKGRPWHVVTHSMGAVVLRCALVDYSPRNLQRIVMLCPPNRGAHAARRLTPAFGWLSPSLSQIADDEDSYVNGLPVDVAKKYEVGIVVAAGDLVVAPECTDLPGVRDTITLPGMHSALLFRADVAQQVVHFLQHGCFDRRGELPVGAPGNLDLEKVTE